MGIYKELEFSAFLKLIEKGQSKHWVEIAKAINVDQDTITKWKKLPEAQQALTKGLSNTLSSMEQVGKNDWRMWHAKALMLGMPNKIDVKAVVAQDPAEEVLKRLGLLNDESKNSD